MREARMGPLTPSRLRTAARAWRSCPSRSPKFDPNAMPTLIGSPASVRTGGPARGLPRAGRSFQAQDVLHVVEPGLLSKNPFGRAQGAHGEGFAAGGLVGKLHPFAMRGIN